MNGKPSFDCAVIGAGPAGIVAAVYLARFCRRTLLLSDGDSRARWIPRTRNVPAYPEGIGGTELLGRLHEQISRYDVLRENAHVQSIQGESDRFTIQAQAGRWSARRILLATGVRDIIPEELRKLWSLVPEGRVRLCPVCDGFELCGKRIALLSRGAHAVREAHFLRAFSKEVVLLTHGAGHLDDAMRKELSGQGIRWIEAPLQDAQSTPSGLSLALKDAEPLQANALYVGFGAEVHSGLARSLGARGDDAGYLYVDQKQQTSVPGVYAAGDVVQSLSQISVAFGQAAIAASAINLSLGLSR